VTIPHCRGNDGSHRRSRSGAYGSISGFGRSARASCKEPRIAATPRNPHVVRRTRISTQKTADVLAISRQPSASAPPLFVHSSGGAETGNTNGDSLRFSGPSLTRALLSTIPRRNIPKQDCIRRDWAIHSSAEARHPYQRTSMPRHSSRQETSLQR